MPNTIKVKRGLEASRTSVTPAEGEFLYTTDQKKVYIGDGTTAGGTAVAPTVTQQVELISTANASGAATVDFTGLSSVYSQYFLVVIGAGLSTTDTIAMRTSSNNGVSWDAGASDYNYQRIFHSATTISGAAITGNSMVLGGLSSVSGGNYLYIQMQNVGVAQRMMLDASTGIPGVGTQRTIGARLSTTAVNGIRLIALSGGVTITGTFKLYGVKA